MNQRAPTTSTAGRVTQLKFGRYEALFRIGLGGMAEVYAARMRGEGGFQKLVAVKRMLPHLTGDPKFVEMFLDEARLAANIASPHVAQTFDLGRAADDSLYIVMELIIGVNLTHFLVYLHEHEKHIDVPLGVEFIAQAAQGLDDAHEARAPTGEHLKLVHRDISPQNIMVGIDGRVRVTDFGIAQALHLRTTQTQAGEKKGKYSYFSPEQAFGNPVDPRTDVFALGVVAWELLLGRRLFPGTPLEALEAVRDKVIPIPHQVRPEIPASVSDVVMKALERDADRRFNTCADFAVAMRRAGLEHFQPPTARDVAKFVSEAGGDWLLQLQGALATADSPTAEEPPVPEQSPNASVVWGALTPVGSTADGNIKSDVSTAETGAPSLTNRRAVPREPKPRKERSAVSGIPNQETKPLSIADLAALDGPTPEGTPSLPKIATRHEEPTHITNSEGHPAIPSDAPTLAGDTSHDIGLPGAMRGVFPDSSVVPSDVHEAPTREEFPEERPRFDEMPTPALEPSTASAPLVDRFANALRLRGWTGTREHAMTLAGAAGGSLLLSFAVTLVIMLGGERAQAEGDAEGDAEGAAPAPAVHGGAFEAPASRRADAPAVTQLPQPAEKSAATAPAQKAPAAASTSGTTDEAATKRPAHGRRRPRNRSRAKAAEVPAKAPEIPKLERWKDD